MECRQLVYDTVQGIYTILWYIKVYIYIYIYLKNKTKERQRIIELNYSLTDGRFLIKIFLSCAVNKISDNNNRRMDVYVWAGGDM